MWLVNNAHRNDLDIFVHVKDVLDRLLAVSAHHIHPGRGAGEAAAGPFNGAWRSAVVPA